MNMRENIDIIDGLRSNQNTPDTQVKKHGKVNCKGEGATVKFLLNKCGST